MIHLVKEALKQYRYRWKMAMFSSLGVIVATLALVASGHITNITKMHMLSEFSQQGTNLLTLMISDPENRLSIEDISRVMADTPHVSSFHPLCQTQISYDENIQISILGTSVNYPDLLRTQVIEGRDLHPNDIKPYLVLSKELQQSLKQEGLLLSTQSQLLGDFGVLEVIGVVDGYRAPNMISQNSNGIGITSLETLASLVPNASPNMIYVAVDSPEAIDQVTHLITGKIKYLHPSISINAFPISALLSMTNTMSDGLNVIAYAVVAICSLLGGIGIMNMTIANITERKSEMALRIAFGAKQSHIRRMLIIETCILCLASGFMGALLGLIISYYFAQFNGWDFVFTPSTLPGSIIFSLLVATFAAQYPAYLIQKIPVAYLLKGE
ncbi:ABC transporter permease [Candidatus Synchoanobacter obligatus]|uniref:ABC transporter permease n=1 Tax=Candidatus Synchoanobacter obligatus TaxID=2919597 RepID=A0ABT1L4N7_9GAMM|nr:ABC transporter permease [Candidatus Synchoanobacter obligatus]MCP8351921.1 ABC transporter permease [Candidatus Synchoanobacter obligatus]